jgi:hypothetical protein
VVFVFGSWLALSNNIKVASQLRSLGQVFSSSIVIHCLISSNIVEVYRLGFVPTCSTLSKYSISISDYYSVLILLYTRRHDLLNCCCQAATAGHPGSAMVQRCHCHGLDFVLYQARSEGPAHYLPGSHRTSHLPLVESKTKQPERTNTIIPGGSLRRIFPSGFHLALLANRAEQVRPAN